MKTSVFNQNRRDSEEKLEYNQEILKQLAASGVDKGAREYCEEDYYIRDRTTHLTNAYKSGAIYALSNLWHDIYKELPPRSGRYLCLCVVDKGEKYEGMQGLERYETVEKMLSWYIDEAGNGKWMLPNNNTIAPAVIMWTMKPKINVKLHDFIQSKLKAGCRPIPSITPEYNRKIWYNLNGWENDLDESLKKDAKDSISDYFRFLNKLYKKPTDSLDDGEMQFLYTLSNRDLWINSKAYDARCWQFEVQNPNEIDNALADGREIIVEMVGLGLIKG